MDDSTAGAEKDLARRIALLPDDYRLTARDIELVDLVLGGQNFSYSSGADGALTWGAFGKVFATLGDLRAIAREHPPAEEGETVGIALFANMLDMIAFLRVRLRAVADVCIEKGLITGPELLARYHTYHERSFQALRDQMLLKPEIFEQRFGEWLETDRDYEKRLELGK